MGKKFLRPRAFKPTDYDQPTEPLERLVLPPSAPVGGWYSEPQNSLSPQEETRPYPQGYVPGNPYTPPSAVPAYPVLPPGGASSAYRPLRIRKRHRTPVPGLVGLCFVLVQLVLLTRVICMLFNVVATTLWLSLLFSASDVLVTPLRWLATTLNVGPLAGTPLLIYLEFLLAILAYGILSRLLVGFLKVLFRN